ncbi:site-specific integrase [Hydrogenovibrio kuenenii]|uniref:site-specific integrase n=1 Tax=Hydrogenovibrio kuenenii TaxID=63658 RepID=UPI0004658106|nr:site-specific integrase [Hydrogenovibrio kuenenii]
MAKPTVTSLTESKIGDFLRSSSVHDKIYCTKITGFYAKRMKNGVSFRLRYQDDFGKRRDVTIGKFSEIKPALAAQKAIDIIAGGVDPLEQKRLTKKYAVRNKQLEEQKNLGSFVNGYYANHISRNETSKEVLSILRRNFGHLFEMNMEDITKQDIQSWQIKREKEVKYATVLKAYQALKAVLNLAEEAEFISKNPLPKKSLLLKQSKADALSFEADNKKKRRILTDEEVSSLFKGIDSYNEVVRNRRKSSIKHGKPDLPSFEKLTYCHWIVPFTYLAYFTGMRSGDLLGLTWDELNLDFGRLVKYPEKTIHHTKANQSPIQIDLPLPNEIIEIMKKWNEQQGNLSTGLVFPSPRAGARMDKKAHLTGWENIKKLGGLDESLNFYSLRHHFISKLVQNGIPLFSVAKLVGHKSTEMIEQHYGHLAPSQAKTALEIMARNMPPNTKDKQKNVAV